MLIITALGKLRQEDFTEFQDIMSYSVILSEKQQTHSKSIKRAGGRSSVAVASAAGVMLLFNSQYHKATTTKIQSCCWVICLSEKQTSK